MKQPRGHRDYLKDILSAGQKAIEFISGVSYEAFVRDEKTSYAVVRALEMMGEAARGIPTEIRDRYPEVPCCCREFNG